MSIMLDHIVQAVNGVGLVGPTTTWGDGYTPGVPVGAQVPPPTITTVTTLEPQCHPASPEAASTWRQP